MIIAHSQHLVSWYGHVDNKSHPPKVKDGQYVAKGQVIAYEGMTGWTTGPHLHWAVQMDEHLGEPAPLPPALAGAAAARGRSLARTLTDRELPVIGVLHARCYDSRPAATNTEARASEADDGADPRRR